MTHVCPTNKFSVSNHKDSLDASELNDFEHDDKVFKKLFEDRREGIVRDEGADKHEQCIRNLLKTYLRATSPEFVTGVKK